MCKITAVVYLIYVEAIANECLNSLFTTILYSKYLIVSLKHQSQFQPDLDRFQRVRIVFNSALVNNN